MVRRFMNIFVIYLNEHVDLYSGHGWNQIDYVVLWVPVSPGESIMTFYVHNIIILIYIL